MRDSTIIYRSFYEAIMEIPEKNQAEVWKAIFEYSLNFKEVKLTGLSKTIFNLIKPQLQANIRKHKAGVEHGHKGAEHGKKGGRPLKNNPLNNGVETLKKPSNDNVKENYNENPSDFVFTPSQKSDTGKAKKKLPRKKKEASEDGQKFASWYNEKMKPEAMRPEPKDLNNWGMTFDQLTKKGYTKNQIFQAVTWARSDEFWRSNFQSPVKLMKSNGDGVKYIDVFLDKANKHKPDAPDQKKMVYHPVAGMVPIT